MTARIARGAPPRGKAKGKSLQRGSARKKAPTALDRLPFEGEAVRRVSSWILAGMLIALLLAAGWAMRVPQLIGLAAGEAVGDAGFAVKRVEPKGLSRMNPMLVYQVAADQLDAPMPLVDLEGTRARLLRYGWVKDARVSRRWPDTLVVDIVERTPAAVWQHKQQLSLIDRDGVVLEPVKLDAMPDLPLVIGPAANAQAGGLSRLLDAAPELKPMMAGATWIGGRRWDLRFQSGEVLALPEGADASRKALVHFAKMDRMTQLLGRGLVRFDMRIPGKFIVRVSREPGSVVPKEEPKAPANGAPIVGAETI